MVEKTITPDLDTLQIIQNRLLLTKLPYHFPGFDIDAVQLNASLLSGSFFDVVHPTPHLVDFIVGEIKGEKVSSLIMATAIKMALLRLAKPVFRGHHFDKIQLWEKGTLTLPEIIKKINEELGELLQDLGLTVNLFYGRLNLEYNMFSYIDCGFTKPLYYSLAQGQSVFLNGSCPPLGSPIKHDCSPIQMTVELGDYFIFYSSHLITHGHEQQHCFSHYHLISLMETYAHSDLPQIVDHILQAMTEVKPKDNNEKSSLIIVFKLNDERPISSFKHATAKFASDLAQLNAVRTFIQRACQQAPGESEKLSLQMQLVINEVFCNVVKHSYHNQPRGEVIIESQLTDKGIYFTISDRGDRFNPTEIKYPNLSGDQEDGFGVFIIQQIADHISYTPKISEDEWNHLRIFKRYFSQEDQMEFSHCIQDNILIITPRGESLDAKNAPVFKDNALNLIRSSGLSYLVFDLKHLQFIDSSGLGTFLAIQRTLHAQGGLLKLANLNKPIRTMFEIVSMHRIFDIFTSTEEAILSFNH